jgi:hypothetical protein
MRENTMDYMQSSALAQTLLGIESRRPERSPRPSQRRLRRHAATLLRHAATRLETGRASP